jgi:hypothetical protein
MSRKPIRRLNKRAKRPDLPISYGRMTTMMGDEQSLVGANRAFAEIDELLLPKAHYQNIRSNPESIEAIREKLADISRGYWDDRHIYEQPSLAERRNILGRVEKTSIKLREVLNSVPVPFKVDLKNQMSPGPLSRNPATNIKCVLHHLDNIIEACNALNSDTGEKGAPAKIHIANAVERCASLWQEITGEKFNKNLQLGQDKDPATGEIIKILVAPSPEFVRRVVLAIDPRLSENEILSAISTMDLGKL